MSLLCTAQPPTPPLHPPSLHLPPFEVSLPFSFNLLGSTCGSRMRLVNLSKQCNQDCYSNLCYTEICMLLICFHVRCIKLKWGTGGKIVEISFISFCGMMWMHCQDRLAPPFSHVAPIIQTTKYKVDANLDTQAKISRAPVAMGVLKTLLSEIEYCWRDGREGWSFWYFGPGQAWWESSLDIFSLCSVGFQSENLWEKRWHIVKALFSDQFWCMPQKRNINKTAHINAKQIKNILLTDTRQGLKWAFDWLLLALP